MSGPGQPSSSRKERGDWSCAFRICRQRLSRLAAALRLLLRDETGVLSLLMVFLVPCFVMFFAAGFDLTLLNNQRRYVQSQADLSALSAARRLPDQADAERVGADVARANASYGVIDVADQDIRLGRFTDAGEFVEATPAEPAVDAVSVRLRSRFRPMLLRPFFGNTELWVVKAAVVRRQDLASLTLRNALLQLSTPSSPLLGPLLGQQLGLNLTLLGWPGLLTTRVTLTELAQLVSAQTGAQLLTFQQVLDADIGLGALLSSMALRGLIPAAALGSTPDVRLSLGEILTVSPEIATASVADRLPDIGLSVQDLLAALAQLSGSKTHRLVNVTTGLSLPPLTSAGLTNQLVDPGKMVLGRVSAAEPLRAEAAQVAATASADVLGLVHLSLAVQAAAASASLTSVNCRASGPDDIVALVEVETHPLTLSLQVRLLERPNDKTFADQAPVSYAGRRQVLSIRNRDLGQVIAVPSPIALSDVTSALSLSLGRINQNLTHEGNNLGIVGVLLPGLVALINGLLNSLSALLVNVPALNGAAQALLDLLGIRAAQAELVLHSVDCRIALVR